MATSMKQHLRARGNLTTGSRSERESATSRPRSYDDSVLDLQRALGNRHAAALVRGSVPPHPQQQGVAQRLSGSIQSKPDESADTRRKRRAPATMVDMSGVERTVEELRRALTTSAGGSPATALSSGATSLARVTQRKHAGSVTPAGPAVTDGAGQHSAPLAGALRAGIEQLSHVSMARVRVHYNSPEPRRFDALAYTQGHDIYLGPGQERHLPHESWHVVQQARQRIPARFQLRGTSINDDAELEREADEMGAKAAALARGPNTRTPEVATSQPGLHTHAPMQRRRATLDRGRFNVAGENHHRSMVRRPQETRCTRDQTGAGYWTESQFQVGGAFGDPSAYRFASHLNTIRGQVGFIAGAQLAHVPTNINLIAVPLALSLLEARTMAGRNTATSFAPIAGALPQLIALLNTVDTIVSTVLPQAFAQLPAAPDRAAQHAELQRIRYYLQLLRRICDLFRVVAAHIIQYGDIDQITTWWRSREMHLAADQAQRAGMRGVWKIGDSHVQDIRGLGAVRAYNLLDMDEFENIFTTWQNNWLPQWVYDRAERWFGDWADWLP